MRDCIFLVADSQMEATFRGFLSRADVFQELGTGQFEFDPAQDIIRATGGNDPGVYVRGHLLLDSYKASHRYAVIVLDNQWDGSPGVTQIEKGIANNMLANGWGVDQFVVIVIDPELETWVLQDAPQILTLFRLNLNSYSSPKPWLVDQRLWDNALPKPTDPKTALQQLLRQSTAQRVPPSAANYQKITSRVSVQHCIDPAFCKLRSTLQTWFPPNVGGTP